MKGGTQLSLLCDDDIIYLSKSKYSDETSQELFDRNKRRHPVWKSEAEYKAYISQNISEGDQRLLTECMKSFIARKTPEYPVPTLINDETLKRCENEYNKVIDSSDRNLKPLQRRVAVCEYLKKYSDAHGFPFDYLVLPASMFSSNFSKDNLRKTLVNFEGKDPMELQSVCSILNSENDKEHTDMYYLYYRRADPSNGLPGKIEDVKDFCEGLVNSSKIVMNS